MPTYGQQIRGETGVRASHCDCMPGLRWGRNFQAFESFWLHWAWPNSSRFECEQSPDLQEQNDSNRKHMLCLYWLWEFYDYADTYGVGDIRGGTP